MRRPGVGVARRVGFRGIGGGIASLPDPAAIFGGDLKLWLRADDVAGDPIETYADQSGTGNSATQATAGDRAALITASDGLPTGDFERTEGDHYVITDHASLNQTGAFTLAWWSQVESWQTSMTVWGHWGSGTGRRFYARLEENGGGGAQRFYIQQRLSTTDNNATYTLGDISGAWAHFAIVYDGGGVGDAGRLKLYLDGVEKTLTYSTTVPATINVANDDVGLGAVSSGANSWDGYLDDIVYVGAAATAAQIADLYAYRPRS